MDNPKKKRLVGLSVVLWLFQAIYTVSPIDLIPDIIPILGLLDDGAGWVITLLFTVWVVRALRTHGPKGIAKAKQTIIDLERRGEQFQPATAPSEGAEYEPMSRDEILAL